MTFSRMGKSSFAPTAKGAVVILVVVVLTILGVGDMEEKVGRNKINPLLALASNYPRPNLLACYRRQRRLRPACLWPLCLVQLPVLPGLGAFPAGLWWRCPTWPAMVPGMEAFVPLMSLPMKIVFSVSILGGLFTNTKKIGLVL
jgi:hypothetical protein